VLLLGAAGILPPLARGALPRPGDPEGLRFFSAREHRILAAVAERMVGAEPHKEDDPIDAAGRADAFLADDDPEIQSQIHLLLAIFGSRLFAFLFDLRLVPFLDMRPADQDTYLEDWMTSSLEFRRTGFVALKRICLSMYYTDSRSFQAIAYEGMFLPKDRP
jgi:hypothetical protein